MENRPHHTILLVVLGLVLIVSAGFFFYTKYGSPSQTNNPMAIFDANYKEAQALQNTGDYTGALDAFNVLLRSVPDKASEGKVKIFIASSLILRKQEGDMARGINIYKEVASDPQIPAFIQAKALTSIANLVVDQDEAFFETYFRDDPRFKDLLPTSGTDRVGIAYLRILQLADAVSPNSYAEYSIVGNYYAPRIGNNSLPGTTTPAQAARIMQDYIKKADLLAPQDESTYKPELVVVRYLYRALGLGASNRILNNVSLQDRENALKLALDKGAPYEHSNNYRTVAVIMWTRFHYAGFLADYFGKTRYPDIVELLKPFGDAASNSSPAFREVRSQFVFSNVIQGGKDNFLRNRAATLEEISPELREFLTSIGFKKP